MAAAVLKYTRYHRSLLIKFHPSSTQCRHLRGTNFEIKYPGKKPPMHTVQGALEELDYPGYVSTKALPKARLKGRHPGEFETLADILKRLNAKDPELDIPIDIGLPSVKTVKEKPMKSKEFLLKQRNNEELEKAARLRTLKIPLEDVKADWEVTDGPEHIRKCAEHYGIFHDLFDDAYFVPRIPLRIAYDYNDELVTPVHRGNHIKPSEATQAPHLHFDAEPDTLWTLVLTNPDGHLLDNSSEYLHWFIGNIPGNSVDKGNLICDYLQPFPPKGTGFHRLIFVLYKQERRVDYSDLQKSKPCFSLKERTFCTYDFYKKNQDVLTPAGLGFFQCDYDESLRDFFHDTLLMKEPIFEYDYPPLYIKPQRQIPFRQPFNLYLEKYRDPQDIGREILLKRFKNVHPFKAERPRPKYPNIYPIPRNTPEWLRTEIFKERMRVGKYRDLDIQIFKPERPEPAINYDPSVKHDKGLD